MPPLVRHAWFGAYSLNKKRPRGARSCILAHFQRVQLFLYETLSKLLLARSRLYEQLRRRPKSRFSQNNVLYTIHKQKRARSARKTIFPPTRKPGPRAQHTKNTLIVLILLFVKKESSSQSSLHTFFCHVIPSHQRCSYPFQGYQSEWRAKSPAGTCRFRRLMIGTSLIKFTIRKHTKMHFLNLSQNFTKFLTFLLRNCSLNSKSTRTRRKNSNLVKNNRRKKPIFFWKIELFNEKIH